jgi:hypothetical protein
VACKTLFLIIHVSGCESIVLAGSNVAEVAASVCFAYDGHQDSYAGSHPRVGSITHIALAALALAVLGIWGAWLLTRALRLELHKREKAAAWEFLTFDEEAIDKMRSTYLSYPGAFNHELTALRMAAEMRAILRGTEPKPNQLSFKEDWAGSVSNQEVPARAIGDRPD